MKEKEKIKIEELFPKLIYLMFVICILILLFSNGIESDAAESYYYQVHDELIIPSTNPYTNANFIITKARSPLGIYENGVLLVPIDTTNYTFKYQYSSETQKYMIDVYENDNLNLEISFSDYVENHNVFLLKNSDGSRFKMVNYSFSPGYVPRETETNNTYWELINNNDISFEDFYPLYVNQKYTLNEDNVMEFKNDFFYFPQMSLGKMADNYPMRITVVSLVKSLIPYLILPIVLVIGFKKSLTFLKKNLI